MKLHPGEIKTILKAEAACLGFSLFGVTGPQRPAEFSRLQKWLSLGMQGGMSYLSRADTLAKRENPLLLMPECQSILLLGKPYPLKSQPSNSDFSIANYALSVDYHLLFPHLLKRLQDLITVISEGRSETRVFTDSAPVLERELGKRAGLGWIGKNSCLINPDFGSTFLIAEIFTDLPLEADAPFPADRCGNCSRCMDACPTGCILPDRTIDARKCISYLTIEEKGAIPEELRNQIGNRVFGCDICQKVCPWNRRTLNAEIANESLVDLSLSFDQIKRIISMREDEFNQVFQDSPLLRIKRQGLLRNLAVCMGNSGSSTYLSLLDEISAVEPHPMLQEHIAWAKKQLSE